MGGVCFPIECDREESLDGGRGGASKAKGAKALSACSKRTSAHLDFVAYCYLWKVVEAGASSSPGRYTACADIAAGETTYSWGFAA